MAVSPRSDQSFGVRALPIARGLIQSSFSPIEQAAKKQQVFGRRLLPKAPGDDSSVSSAWHAQRCLAIQITLVDLWRLAARG